MIGNQLKKVFWMLFLNNKKISVKKTSYMHIKKTTFLSFISLSKIMLFSHIYSIFTAQIYEFFQVVSLSIDAIASF